MACNSCQEFGLFGRQVQREGVLLGKRSGQYIAAEGQPKVSYSWREIL